jgi:hypothetical protein
MRSVVKRLHLAVPAEAVWDIVGNVARIDWVPVITSCQLDGDVRTMQMTGVGTVQERILHRDAESMSLEYGLINNANVAVHKATLKVMAVGNGCELQWTTLIEPDALEPLIESGMQSAIVALCALLGVRSDT